MITCNCGERFVSTLQGAWQAKLHTEDLGHRLRPAEMPRRVVTPALPTQGPTGPREDRDPAVYDETEFALGASA